jgi:hypothetical protein
MPYYFYHILCDYDDITTLKKTSRVHPMSGALEKPSSYQDKTKHNQKKKILHVILQL